MKHLLTLIAVAMIAGCATYQKQPLPTKGSWPEDISRLEIDPSQMPFPELAFHKFDPADGLDMTEIAMIAVANNPALKLARDDAGIASAQAYAARLLPDPQIAFTPQFPQNNIPGENVTAFDLGLNYDLAAIMTRSLRVSAADANHRQADLILLWQEWQVVGQARLLFSRICTMQDSMGILKESRSLIAIRYDREKASLKNNDLIMTAVMVDGNALQGIDQKISDTERLIGKDRHALNALLGLAPDTQLNLVGDARIAVLDKQEIAHRLSNLARTRPDLMALEAGYEAQDLRLRQAILSQFPAINLGLIRARDNTGINYNGFSLNLGLPIFDRNRGNIAIEKATRKRMYDEFKLRLDQAYGDVEQILSDQDLLEKHLDQLSEDIDNLSLLSSKAESVFETGDMDLTAYANLKDMELSKKSEKNAVMESILEERIALLTLLGGELPVKESK